MELLDSDKIIGLPAETKSGETLGRVSGFEIDVDSHSIITYRVKYKGIIEGLFKDQIFVRRNQVVSIDEEKIVVDDGVYEEIRVGKTAKMSVAVKKATVIQSHKLK